MPHEPGAIVIDTTGGWQLDRVMLTDQGKRPVVQLHNAATGIIVSYLLEHDPPYYDTVESCRNDVLGGILGGPLAKATVKNKQSISRQLPNGQTLLIGSYLIAKAEGFEPNDQNVFGFLAHDHTCATIHLSRTNFRPGDEHLFDVVLNNFTFEPDYIPTPEDDALMAKLLPPGMGAVYDSRSTEAADAGPRKLTGQSSEQSLTFALPEHTGYLHMDAPNFAIAELSAKPNGREFGIRARDTKISGTEILGFLFLPDPSQPTAAACRDWMIKLEEKDGNSSRKILSRSQSKSDSGVDIALIDYEQGKAPAPFHYVRRAFIAGGDLCADISVTGRDKLATETTDATLHSVVFDPSRPPDSFSKFRFATALFDHHAFAAAAPVYAGALSLVDKVDDSRKWRRVATDQASIAYGIAGDLKSSREINEAAIARDPDYPLYYYNMACADAEEGNAAAAREHLQQAFDRRANTLPGEKMPDPTHDDSIIKLKHDKSFWDFVLTLPHS
jgi:tetratricopeptide (TPR) repeat protein